MWYQLSNHEFRQQIFADSPEDAVNRFHKNLEGCIFSTTATICESVKDKSAAIDSREYDPVRPEVMKELSLLLKQSAEQAS